MSVKKDRIKGAVVGSQIGNALGAPVHLKSLLQIQDLYGKMGVSEYEVAYGKKGSIADFSQIMLWTADGVLRAHNRFLIHEKVHVPSVVYFSMLRFLATQGFPPPDKFPDDLILNGYLYYNECLHSRRGADEELIKGLLNEKRKLSQSPSCLASAIPIGISPQIDRPYNLAYEVAGVLTTDKTTLNAAAFLSLFLRHLIMDKELKESLQASLRIAIKSGMSLQTEKEIQSVTEFSGPVEELPLSSHPAVQSLQIAIYSAFNEEDDFRKAVLKSVNHSFFSAQCGAICGAILGAYLGTDIEINWIEELETKDIAFRIADDLAAHFVYDGQLPERDLVAYPWH